MKLVSPHGCHESSRHAGNTTNGLGDDYGYRTHQERVPRLLSLVEIEYEKTRGLWILLPDALPGCLASMIAAWPLTAQ
jgi:hypothetical protein